MFDTLDHFSLLMEELGVALTLGLAAALLVTAAVVIRGILVRSIRKLWATGRTAIGMYLTRAKSPSQPPRLGAIWRTLRRHCMACRLTDCSACPSRATRQLRKSFIRSLERRLTTRDTTSQE